MGLYGDYTPKGEDPAWYPTKIMTEAQSLAGMKDYKTGHEKDLGARLAPHKKNLRNVEMAYEIIAYPLLKSSEYGLEVASAVRDAQANPNVDIEENPHRAPVTLDDAELKLLGIISQARGVPFNPEKRVYKYNDLVARLYAE